MRSGAVRYLIDVQDEVCTISRRGKNLLFDSVMPHTSERQTILRLLCSPNAKHLLKHMKYPGRENEKCWRSAFL